MDATHARPRQLAWRFWAVILPGILSAVVAGVTLVSGDWFEFLFKMGPDGGNGTFEWKLVGTCGVVTLASTIYGWLTLRWKRAAHEFGHRRPAWTHMAQKAG